MELVFIPKDNIDDVWQMVENPIKEALSYSGNHHNSEFVLNTLKKGKFQMWIVWDKDKNTIQEKYNGVCITEIIQRTLKKLCHIFIMTGKNRQKWQHLVKNIEDFAKDQQCDQLELIARPGWEKILKQFNYKKTHVVLEKLIEEKK